MSEAAVARLHGLTQRVETVLLDFIAALQACCASDLVSVVLFGSAVDGRLTAASDVNIIVVLHKFDGDRMSKLRDAYLAAEAAIKLQAMFVLEDELAYAAELFGQKFADVLRRHRILYGRDVISTLRVPRAAEIFRLRQVILNLTLRLREAYVSRGERPEQAVRLLADMLGPMRAAAATLLELEGAPSSDGSAALATVAAACGPPSERAAVQLLAAHDDELTDERPDGVLLQVIECLICMSQRAARLS